MSLPANVTVDPHAPRHTGCVKWFDNRKGFGFVNRVDENGVLGGELFVHHSCLVTKDNCFRTLYPGEYVQFVLYNDAQSGRDYAVNVTGINGGSLQCENANARLSVRRATDGFQNVDRKQTATRTNDAGNSSNKRQSRGGNFHRKSSTTQ
jgi:cold shock CspA family protein